LKTVRLLGALYHDTEWYAEECDHWALNNFHRRVDENHIDAWFQMHPRTQWESGRNGKDHIQWLKKKHDFPVYMQQRYRGVPSAVKYPKKDADALWPLPCNPIYGDTFCYQVALAILKEYKAIWLVNVNLNTPVEAYLEAPAFGIWLGIAASRGLKILGDSRILSPFQYGYNQRVPPLWSSRELAALTMIDEVPPMKNAFAEWEHLKTSLGG
jgi:hypothetical protein